jgi:hypothetical protein
MPFEYTGNQPNMDNQPQGISNRQSRFETRNPLAKYVVYLLAALKTLRKLHKVGNQHDAKQNDINGSVNPERPFASSR